MHNFKPVVADAVDTTSMIGNLAQQLCDRIDQVEESYRANLIFWIRKIIGQQQELYDEESGQDLLKDLIKWLSELPLCDMSTEYDFLYTLCDEATVTFGKKRDGSPDCGSEMSYLWSI